MKITHAIIPAAGLGTRFLPYTKAVPKEMLPLLNFPAIHRIVEEGVSSSIDQFVMIINKRKQAIIDYFTPDFGPVPEIRAAGKIKLLSNTEELCKQITMNYVEQPKALGLGHAILLAADLCEKNPVAVMLPDDIIINPEPGLAQLIKIAAQQKASVIAVQEVSRQAISAYGCIAIKKQINENLFDIDYVVEKPRPDEAPSQLAIIGRYIFMPSLFHALTQIKPHVNGELQLTDAISYLISQGEKIFAYRFQGNRFDLGTPSGWLEANNFIMEHQQTR